MVLVRDGCLRNAGLELSCGLAGLMVVAVTFAGHPVALLGLGGLVLVAQGRRRA